MYRRIEIIDEYAISDQDEKEQRHFKSGLLGATAEGVVEAWCGEGLKGPGHSIPHNSRFYFTELGWEKIGRRVVAACQKYGQNYRVVKIKENKINVIFRDPYEVAGQPVRRWRKETMKRFTKRNWHIWLK